MSVKSETRFSISESLTKMLLPELRLCYWGCISVDKWLYAYSRRSFWCAYYNFHPGALVEWNNHVYTMTPDHFLLIAPGTIFRTESDRQIRHFFLHFTANCHLSRQEGVFEIPATHMISRIEEIIAEDEQRNSFRNLLRLQALIADLMTELPDKALNLESSCSLQDQRILKLLEVIKTDSSKNYNNRELAEMAGLSINQLLRNFRRVTGTTPQIYIQRERIHNACAMLHFSDFSIDEVADATGFCDRYHFSRVFRKMTGEPPAQFKKRNLINIKMGV